MVRCPIHTSWGNFCTPHYRLLTFGFADCLASSTAVRFCSAVLVTSASDAPSPLPTSAGFKLGAGTLSGSKSGRRKGRLSKSGAKRSTTLVACGSANEVPARRWTPGRNRRVYHNSICLATTAATTTMQERTKLSFVISSLAPKRKKVSYCGKASSPVVGKVLLNDQHKKLIGRG